MPNKLTVFDCSLLYFPKIENRAGNITPIHGNVQVPFDIVRIYYIYDIPGGKSRGGHAKKTCHQVYIAASGSFDIVLDDSCSKRSLTLNRPYHGLHIPPGIWSEVINFSSGSVCLALTSTTYDPDDYIRDYVEFKHMKAQANVL